MFCFSATSLRHSEAIANGSKDCSQVRVLHGDVATECVRRGVRLANCALLGRDAACTRYRTPGMVVTVSTTTVDAVTLRLLSNLPIAEWSISGIVRDGVGNPVAGV